MAAAPLSLRKCRILAAIVEHYIRTGEPVGSKVLAQALGNAVSSATIRNEMAELDEMGYLEQPHTSAGRIPTAPAFRLYVDQLMPHRRLEEEGRRDIDRRLAPALGDPDRLVSEAAETLASLTGCAAVSTPPTEREARVRRLETMVISPHLAAAVLMTDSGLIRNRLCRFTAAPDPVALHSMATALQARFDGARLGEITTGAMQELLTAFGDYGAQMMPLLTAVLELARDAAEAEITLKGEWNLLRHPDYDSDRIRALLGYLTRQELLGDMLAGAPAGLQVLLGSESTRPELKGSSLILTRYRGAGGGSGTIGVIGPVRMDYAAAIPRIEYLADTLTRLLLQLTE